MLGTLNLACTFLVYRSTNIDFGNFVFWAFHGQKCAQKWRQYWIFGGHKKTKKQNFRNCYFRFVEHHTRKVHTKFKVLSMYGVQMNVLFRNRALKFLRVK